MKPLPTLASTLATAAVIAVGGCGDEAVTTDGAENTPAPLAATTEERALMLAALRLAQDHMLVVQRSPGADRLSGVLDRLAHRIESNDRVAVEHEVAAANAAIRQARDAGKQDGSAAELEAMALTVDRIAALARQSERATPSSNSSRELES
jgi:hypothetical protein